MPELEPQSLKDRLIAQIESDGPLPFSAFMARALYEPGLGFYRREWERERGNEVIGQSGHFYTSVSVGSLFGELLGARIKRQWDLWGSPGEWVLAEQGANDGRLMTDILTFFRSHHPEVFSGLRCWIFEPDPALRCRQETCFRENNLMDWIEWHDAPSDIEDVHEYGFFYSNELLDSLPFDLVVYRGGEWREKRVGMDGDRLTWSETPCGPELKQSIRHWGVPELEGYQTEVHPGISGWGKSVYGLFSRGMILTIDYGFRSREYYAPSRKAGTARSYREHRLSHDLIAEPGNADLTCHVNFDLLEELGEKAGYEVTTDCDQHHFLVEMADQSGLLAEWESRIKANPDDPDIQSRLRQFKTLMHPEMMGTQFKVFIQESRETEK